MGFNACGSGSRVLMTKNWKKLTDEKKLNFFDQKLQFGRNYKFNLLIPRLPLRTSKLQESLQPSKENNLT
jgi:hypothetical protein